jgi:transcriptional regulator with XRE-family HTH domain
MLNLTQSALAKAANISTATLHNIERGAGTPRASTLSAIRHALEDAGAQFIPEKGGGAGVRLRKRKRPTTSQSRARARKWQMK